MTILPAGLAGSFPDPQLETRLQAFQDLLLDWNTRVNLISRKEAAPWIHLQDSLWFASRIEAGGLEAGGTAPSQKLVDVGTGAGFPGLVTALARPDLRVTLVEPQQKKQAFLQAAVRALDLRNVSLLEARAERGALCATRTPQSWRGPWDHAVCKALTDPAGFARMAAPLARCLWFLASEEQASSAAGWTVDARWTVADGRPRVLLTMIVKST